MALGDRKKKKTNALETIDNRYSNRFKNWIADGTWSKAVSTPAALSGIVAKIPQTDLEIVRVMHAMLASSVHYNTSDGWYTWNGRVHEKDETDTAGRAIIIQYGDALETILEHLYTQVAGFSSTQEQDKGTKILAPISGVLKNLRSNGGMNSVESVMKTFFRVPNNYFDSGDSRWLVMRNGDVIDIAATSAHKGAPVILPPDESRPVTRSLGVTVDEETGSNPVWFLSHLRETVGDEQDIAYLQEAAGAAILGEGTAKNIPHLVGPRNSFKSVYLNIMAMVFGSYAGTLPAAALVLKNGGSNFAQSRARGIRFLYLSEPQTSKTDDAFLKNLSGGGEPINTEEKGKDFVNWRARCVLHIAANHVVKFDTKDDAIVNRMNIVEFTHQVSDEDVDPALAERIVDEEGSEIFMWALEGGMRYLKRGSIYVPDCIKARAQRNVVGASAPLRWLTEALEEGYLIKDPNIPAYKCMTRKTAWTMFTDWMHQNDERIGFINQKTFHDEIDDFMKAPKGKRGSEFKANKQIRVWGLQTLTQASGMDDGGSTTEIPQKPLQGGRTIDEMFRGD